MKERKKGRKKRRRKLFSHCFQIWVDQELVLHTSRGEGSFLLGYFLVWGHGNGIWLSLVGYCLNEEHAEIGIFPQLFLIYKS